MCSCTLHVSEASMKSLAKRYAPWLLLGPLTGPLAEGVYRNLKANNPVLAGLYLMATVSVWFDMAKAGQHAVNVLAAL